MEIGSIYEMNPNCIEKMNPGSGGSLRLKEVDKYGKNNTIYTASAREAISLVLHSVEKEYPKARKKCLMPAYMCDTVFIPFVRAGWELVFYHIDRDMKADKTELEALIRSECPDLLFIHDYYGIDTWAGMRIFLEEHRSRGLLIMEDVTQTYYMDAGTTADYIIGSLRKWYAVPDGGFVATNHTIHDEIMVKDDAFAMERFRVLSRKWDYLQKIQDKEKILDEEQKESLKRQKQEYLSQNRELEERLDNYNKVTAISDLAKELLAVTDEETAKQRRNDNYGILSEGLADRKTVKQVMAHYEGDAMPLYFPVYMEDRDVLQEYLRKQDIYVPVLWPVAKENEPVLSDTERYIYSHIAAIPMDQRYEKADMERIVAAIKEFEETCQ